MREVARQSRNYIIYLYFVAETEGEIVSVTVYRNYVCTIFKYFSDSRGCLIPKMKYHPLLKWIFSRE